MADLITLRGAARLREADVVLFDALADPALRELAPMAEWIDVGKRGFVHATQQAQINRDAQQVLQDEAVAQRQNYSGVNLDEEAANLLRYQQAYQASGKMIEIASKLFDTLLALGR